MVRGKKRRKEENKKREYDSLHDDSWRNLTPGIARGRANRRQEERRKREGSAPGYYLPPSIREALLISLFFKRGKVKVVALTFLISRDPASTRPENLEEKEENSFHDE